MPDTAPARLPGVPRWRRGGSMECVLTPQTDSAGQYVRSSQSGAQVCGSGWFCPLCALRTYCPALFVCSRKHCISIDLPLPTRNTRQHGRGRVRHAPASPPWLREVVVRAEGFWLFDRVCGAEMRDKIGVW